MREKSVMSQSDPVKLTGFVLFILLCQGTASSSKSPHLLLTPGETELNVCKDGPSEGPCEGNLHTPRYFYNRTSQSCVLVNDCDDVPRGFPDLSSCQSECMKKRLARRIPSESKYEILADIEMTFPRKLSKSTKRKFPLNFCSLQWDSGLICPGFRRGDFMDQFYYDDKTNTCNPFVYNGCGGNANRFNAIWECIQSCVRKSSNRKIY